MATRVFSVGALVVLGVCACGGGDQNIARKNAVFYDHTTIGADLQARFETPYPPLDLEKKEPNPQYKGVEVLEGKVKLSRPANWTIRAASNRPGERYIQYLSPREYIFSVYERRELPNALWSDVISRYEASLEDNKAEILHKGVPIATFDAQGRAYSVRRRVPAAKSPFINASREYLIRGNDRVVLVQIVHPPVGMEPIEGELRRVIDTMMVR
ncbi:MAG: hypothetical protein ACOC1F_09610 [Myxococcota bacterium]